MSKITMQNSKGETMDIDLNLVALLLVELDSMIKASEADFFALLVTRDALLKEIKNSAATDVQTAKGKKICES